MEENEVNVMELISEYAKTVESADVTLNNICGKLLNKSLALPKSKEKSRDEYFIEYVQSVLHTNQIILRVAKNSFILWNSGCQYAEDRAQEEIAETQKKIDNGTLSDGYHTFNELYNYRKAYNAALFNEWAKNGKYNVYKSKRHNTGELCFNGGWFVVMADLPTGQISNHYELKDWDLFKCPEREKAEKWDGHTPQQAYDRLISFIKSD
jgi:hypothetical protein